MRIYETRTIPARTERALASIKCDLCGRAATDTTNWSGQSYEIDGTAVRVEVRQEKGESYPEGGRVESRSYDICPTCFEDVLVPFLESKGAKPIKEEVDF